MTIEPLNSDAIIGRTESLIGIGKYLLDKENYNESIETLNKVLIVDNNNKTAIEYKIIALILLGHEALGIKEYQKALNDFNEVIKLEPNNSLAINGKHESLLKIGKLLNYENKYQEAYLNFEEASKLKNDIETCYNLGLAAYDIGDFKKSITCFDQVLAEEPGNIGAISKRGYAHYQQKSFEDAFKSANHVLSLDESNIFGWILKIKTYMLTGRFKSALIGRKSIRV